MEEEKQDKNKKNNSKINSNNQKETPEFHSEKYKKKSEYPNFLLRLIIPVKNNLLCLHFHMKDIILNLTFSF